jgi:hypothetical protein
MKIKVNNDILYNVTYTSVFAHVLQQPIKSPVDTICTADQFPFFFQVPACGEKKNSVRKA